MNSTEIMLNDEATMQNGTILSCGVIGGGRREPIDMCHRTLHEGQHADEAELPIWKRELILKKKWSNRLFSGGPLVFNNFKPNPRREKAEKEEPQVTQCNGELTSGVDFVSTFAASSTIPATESTTPPLKSHPSPPPLPFLNCAGPAACTVGCAATTSGSRKARTTATSLATPKFSANKTIAEHANRLQSYPQNKDGDSSSSRTATGDRSSSSVDGDNNALRASQSSSYNAGSSSSSVANDMGPTPTPGDVPGNNEQQRPFLDQMADEGEEEEFEYGPGIVGRLRSKFISLTLKTKDNACFTGSPVGGSGSVTPPPIPPTTFHGNHGSPIRRVASLEDLLDDDDMDGSHDSRQPNCPMKQQNQRQQPRFYYRNSNSRIYNNRFREAGGGGNSGRCSKEVLKRARSVEALSSAVMSAPPPPFINDNVVIIDRPRAKPPKDGAVDSGNKSRVPNDLGRKCCRAFDADDEFPKPDTVRTYKRLFESNPADAEKLSVVEGGNNNSATTVVSSAAAVPPVKRKVTPPPKPPGLKPGPKPTRANLNNIKQISGKLVNAPRGTRTTVVDDIVVDAAVEKPAEPCAATNEPEKSTAPSKGGEEEHGSPVVSTERILPVSVLADTFNNNNGLHPEIGAKKLVTRSRSPSPLASVEADEAKPKVISTQPKTDDGKPVGHIRPFLKPSTEGGGGGGGSELPSPSSAVKSTATTEEVVTVAAAAPAPTPVTSFLPSKVTLAAGHLAVPVSQTFNFVGKNVQPNITNKPPPPHFHSASDQRRKNRENLSSCGGGGGSHHQGASYIIENGGCTPGEQRYSDEEDDDVTDGCGGGGSFMFIGENVIVGRSAILKTRNKQLRIAFDDAALSTYEYPSENSLIEAMNGAAAMASEEEDDDDDDDEHVRTETEKMAKSEAEAPGSISTYATKPTTSLKSTPGIGSSGGAGSLATYTPMAVGKDAHVFELGVSRVVPSATSKNSNSEGGGGAVSMGDVANDLLSLDTSIDDVILKPASDDQNMVWSSSSDTSDILF